MPADSTPAAELPRLTASPRCPSPSSGDQLGDGGGDALAVGGGGAGAGLEVEFGFGDGEDELHQGGGAEGRGDLAFALGAGDRLHLDVVGVLHGLAGDPGTIAFEAIPYRAEEMYMLSKRH